jgi:sporulation protein YlmC with PRC-barrel domain
MSPQMQPEKSFGLVLSASTLKGDNVVNPQGEDLGKIEEIMIDLDRGRIAYTVLSFGGFMGLGDKLFAIPWQAFTVDTANKRLILNAKRELLEKATGFD